jgi:hypothetical protein
MAEGVQGKKPNSEQHPDPIARQPTHGDPSEAAGAPAGSAHDGDPLSG